jgi:hypothetical protein
MAETVRAGLEWTTAGIDKLEALNARVKELETRLGSGLPAAAGKTVGELGKTSSAAAISGERMAKYSTSIGLVTGSMQRMGVQNELVARSIGIVTEGFSGMLGPIGLVVIAVGGLVAWVGSLVTEQARYREEVDKSIDTLLRFRGLQGGAGGMAGDILLMRENELLREREKLMAKLAALRDEYQNPKMMDAFLVGVTGQSPVNIAENDMRALSKEALETYNKLAMVEDKLKKIFPPLSGFYGPEQLPGATPGGEGRRIFGPTPGERQTRYGGLRPALGGEGAMEVPGEMVSGKTPEQLREEAAVDSYAALSQMQIDHEMLMLGSWERMSTTGQMAYKSIAAVGQTTTQVTSKIVAAALAGENMTRLKGLAVAKAVAAGAAAAVIRGLGDEAAKKSAYYAAQALAHWGTPKMATDLAASAAFGALAGGAQAVASSIESRAMGNMDRQLQGASRLPDAGGSIPVSAGPNPGARAVQSGIAPSTINYNVIITYQGAVVYGDGGAGDFYRNEILPRLRESHAIGEL